MSLPASSTRSFVHWNMEGILALSARHGLKMFTPRCLSSNLSHAGKGSHGRQVAIIGGGNAAIDSARTVMRMGASATILYRRERQDMPPSMRRFRLRGRRRALCLSRRTAPHSGRSGRQREGHRNCQDAPGRVRQERPQTADATDEVQRFECDSVILAVGETFDQDFCRASGLELKKKERSS